AGSIRAFNQTMKVPITAGYGAAFSAMSRVSPAAAYAARGLRSNVSQSIAAGLSSSVKSSDSRQAQETVIAVYIIRPRYLGKSFRGIRGRALNESQPRFAGLLRFACAKWSSVAPGLFVVSAARVRVLALNVSDINGNWNLSAEAQAE